jgi:hypothetical protein
LPSDDDADIDELLDALEALEAPAPPAVVDDAEVVEATDPEPQLDTPPLDVEEQPTALDDALAPGIEDGAPTDEQLEPGTVLEAASSAVAPEAAAADPEETLEQLDDEIAENVDKMLHGEFESVDELLEGGFDEPAPVPPDPDEGARASSETGVVSEIAVAAPPDEGSAEPAAANKGEGVVDPRDFIDLGGSGPESTPAEEPQPPPTLDEETPSTAEEPEILAKPDPAPEPEAEPVGAAAPQEPAAQPQFMAFLIRLLEWMNVPRRYLPPTARVIVDWVALSLVFWVPVVWLFALLFVGS